MELFLTSSVHAVANDIAKNLDLSEKNRLVFIDTAAEPEKSGDVTWLENDRKALVDAGFDVFDYTVTGKTKDQIASDLSDVDYIYLSGGNSSHLLLESQKSGFIDLVKTFVQEGKIYIGTSAGSVVAGPKLPEYYLHREPKLEDATGYGFVNFTIAPHWGSEHFKDEYLPGRMEIAYTEDQVPFLLLTDTQYVHVKDENLRIIDNRQ